MSIDARSINHTNTQQHVQSYYAATANTQASYPLLQETVHTDVCVVGGGFSGLNTALELAQRGYQVTLLEANRIGWGATGRNGGQVLGGIGYGHQRFEKHIGKAGIKTLFDMGNECVDIVRQRIEEHHIDCDFKLGYMTVGLKPRHIREFFDEYDYLESMGYPHPVQLLNKQQVTQQVASDIYEGGIYFPTGHGHCHVLNLALGEAQAAQQAGVRIYEQSKAIKITQGDQPSVETKQGQVNAKHLVLCGNAYLGNLVPYLEQRILPVSSSIAVTAPLSKAIQARLIPNNIAICDARTVLDYYRLTGDGRLLFGGLANYTGQPPKNLLNIMSKKIARVFPQLSQVKLDYAWSGQIGVGLNRMPQLGRLEGNVYYVQAYAGHGVAPSHLMGRIIAQMIAGQAESFDIFAKIPHQKFWGGPMLRMPSFALAMAYYQLKDTFF